MIPYHMALPPRGNRIPKKEKKKKGTSDGCERRPCEVQDRDRDDRNGSGLGLGSELRRTGSEWVGIGLDEVGMFRSITV